MFHIELIAKPPLKLKDLLNKPFHPVKQYLLGVYAITYVNEWGGY